MEPAALIYLDDADARRLVVAWPLVCEGNPSASDRPRRWAQLSGVKIRDVMRLGDVLLAHGICLPGGVVPDLARKYVAQLALAKIPRRREAKT